MRTEIDRDEDISRVVQQLAVRRPAQVRTATPAWVECSFDAASMPARRTKPSNHQPATPRVPESQRANSNWAEGQGSDGCGASAEPTQTTKRWT